MHYILDSPLRCYSSLLWFRVGAQVCTWGCSLLTPQPLSACITYCSLWHQCTLCQLHSMRVHLATPHFPWSEQSPKSSSSIHHIHWGVVAGTTAKLTLPKQLRHGRRRCTSNRQQSSPRSSTRFTGSKHHPGAPLCQAAKLSETP